MAGGVTAGGLLYTSSSKKSLRSEPESSSKKEEPKALEKTCVVYVTKIDTSGGIKKVKEITKKVEGNEIESFLKEQNPKVSSTFSDDVRKACKGSNQSFSTEDKLNVFVYQKEDKSWIYSRDLQKDWFKDEEIKQLNLG